jgi:hypothetical protein
MSSPGTSLALYPVLHCPARHSNVLSYLTLSETFYTLECPDQDSRASCHVTVAVRLSTKDPISFSTTTLS